MIVYRASEMSCNFARHSYLLELLLSRLLLQSHDEASAFRLIKTFLSCLVFSILGPSGDRIAGQGPQDLRRMEGSPALLHL
jgi:hypothetical protein